MRMKVLIEHVWQDRKVRAGQEYEATADEADLVERLGWARRIVSSTSAAPRAKRQYHRRDMTAGK